MDLTRLYTPVKAPRDPAPLEPGARILPLGSCFAAHAAQALAHGGFAVIPPPMGILYNPLSLARCLARLADGRPFDAADLIEEEGRFISLEHSGAFGRPGAEETLGAMNGALAEARGALPHLDALILTLGTAYVYEDREDGRPVASCHRLPRSRFRRRAVGVDEGADALLGALAALQDGRSPLKVIVSVSPVRHLRDDPMENSRSKAICRLIADRLAAEHPGARYFPAFEIILDELRDYRFYGPDRAHPTEEAVAHVVDRFCEAHLSRDAQALFAATEPIRRGLAHRPRDAQSPAHLAFLNGLRAQLESLGRRFPEAALGPLWEGLKSPESVKI